VKAPWRLSRETWLDCVLAAVMTTIAVSSVFTTDDSVAYDYPPADARLVLLAMGAGLPLALRRVHPYTALLISAASITPIMALRWNEGVTPLCTLFLLYSVAVYRPFRVALAGLATVLGMFAFFALVGAPFFDSPAAFLSSAIFCTPWAIGLSVRRQRMLREQAMKKALAAERELAAAEERAVFAERLRIARELHDVVSHTLSVVAVQSGVARHLMESQPERVAPALEAIENSSRTALDDLRRMLGVLREAPGEESDEAPQSQLSPTPDLRDIEALVALHRESHGPVELTIDPAATQMPASVRLTVYRIVQEALTNARKHAPLSPVRINVAATAGDVSVVIDNDATELPSAAAASGFGLAGMRERVGLFGGEFEAGPTRGGGFRVRVLLPGVARGEAVAT
jgi:signal transduction histidine kinase